MVGTKQECMRFLIDAPEKTYQVTEWHPKRTLTVNSFYWALLKKLSDYNGIPEDDIHKHLVRELGIYKLNKATGNPIHLTSNKSIDLDSLDGYWKEWKDYGNGFCEIIALEGSRGLDSKQFSRLLDSLIYECKEVNRMEGHRVIETMSKNELERLKGYAPKDKSDSD